MTRVLVVDDQDLVRAGLVALLRAAPAGYTVVEAASGEKAVEIAGRGPEQPDVVLMDIRMPGMDGITAITRILGGDRADPPRILVLTTFDLDEYVLAALRAGASGFLLKSTPADRLFAAVDAVAAGDLPFTPSITHRLIEAFVGAAGPGSQGPPVDGSGFQTLTPRERDVFHLVATGLSNADIAKKLVLAEATVKTHLYRGMTKLGLTSRAQAIAYAYETGLITPRRT